MDQRDQADKMTAYCGLNCSECPTWLATQADDDDARAKVAAQWSKMFGMQLTAVDINCDGCKSGSGRLFGHCQNCQVRQCAGQKSIETCADCEDYACEVLSGLFAFIPQAKEALEEIRAQAK